MLKTLLNENLDFDQLAIVVVRASMHKYNNIENLSPEIISTEQYYIIPESEVKKLTDIILFFSTVDSECDQLLYRLKQYAPYIVELSNKDIYDGHDIVYSDNFNKNILSLRNKLNCNCPVYIFMTSKNDNMRYGLYKNDKNILLQDYGVWFNINDDLTQYSDSINKLNPLPKLRCKLNELSLKNAVRDCFDFDSYLNIKNKELNIDENDDMFASMMAAQNNTKKSNNMFTFDTIKQDDEDTIQFNSLQPDELVSKDDIKIWNYDFDQKEPTEYRYTVEIESLNEDPSLSYTRSFVANKSLSLSEIFNRLWPEAARRYNLNLDMKKAHVEYKDAIEKIMASSDDEFEKQMQILQIPFPKIASIKFGEDNIDIVSSKKLYNMFTDKNIPAGYYEDFDSETIQFNKPATNILTAKSIIMNERSSYNPDDFANDYNDSKSDDYENKLEYQRELYYENIKESIMKLFDESLPLDRNSYVTNINIQDDNNQIYVEIHVQDYEDFIIKYMIQLLKVSKYTNIKLNKRSNKLMVIKCQINNNNIK